VNKKYTLYNLSEEDMDGLFVSIATERLYSRISEITKITSINSNPNNTFMDGTPKYKIEINSTNSELIKRFGHKK